MKIDQRPLVSKVRMRTCLEFTLTLGAIGIIWLAVILVPRCRLVWSFWSFDHLEQRARKITTAEELQTWATNLLNQYPSNAPASVWPSQLGTNFPTKLLKLYHSPPHIFIFAPTADWPDPHLSLTWGGGVIGHTGFEIGPTNFTVWGATNAWAPGVYFFKKP